MKLGISKKLDTWGEGARIENKMNNLIIKSVSQTMLARVVHGVKEKIEDNLFDLLEV